MKGEKKKAAAMASNDKIVKFTGFGTKKSMVVKELNMPISVFDASGIHSGQAVVAKDERGEYVTSDYYVDANLADPFRNKRIRPPVMAVDPLPEPAVIEEVKAVAEVVIDILDEIVVASVETKVEAVIADAPQTESKK